MLEHLAEYGANQLSFLEDCYADYTTLSCCRWGHTLKCNLEYILESGLQFSYDFVHVFKVEAILGSRRFNEIHIHLSYEYENLEPPGVDAVSILLLVSNNVRIL